MDRNPPPHSVNFVHGSYGYIPRERFLDRALRLGQAREPSEARRG